jgi:hypothetical protein
MRINPPSGLKFEYNGSVLLEYFGSNYSLENCITSKAAFLYFKDNMSKSKIIDIVFEVVFFQFQSEKLKLNFTNSDVLIERDNDFHVIGKFILDKICIEDNCIIISGNYQHDTINLAWFNEDLVKFNFIINIDKRNNIFIKNFKRFSTKYSEITEKIFFFNM